MKGLLAKKVGMINYFTNDGNSIPITVIEAGPCYITQIKTAKNDGYDALQIGFLQKKKKHTVKSLMGHYSKAGVEPLKVLAEFAFDKQNEFKLGDIIKADIFKVGEKVKVTGISKGRGFAGVVKRHKFKGGPKTHGQSDRLRAPGSLGQSSYPSRVYKGMKMAGRMGNVITTVKNLEIIKVEPEKNYIFLKGGIPGHNNGILRIIKK